MAVINKIDGINISVITKLIGRERAVFAKRTRHTFGGGDQDNVPGLEENLGLTLHGNAQLVNGVLELDGSAGTYASLPHSTDYERESGDLTVSLWFNANSLPGTNDGWGLIAKSTGQHAWDGWLTAYSTQGSGIGGAGPQMTTGGIATYIDQTGSGKPSHNYRAAPAGGLPPGVWHHVAVTMPATGDYSIFVNGESILSWSPASRNTSTNTNLLFGGIMTDGVTKFFSGKIDGVVIQKQILTDQEISDLHAAGRGSSGPSGNGTFVEESGQMTITNGSLVDGVLSTNNSKIRKSDMLSLASAVGDTNKAVFSAWFKANSFDNAYWLGLFGNYNYQKGFTARIRRTDGAVSMSTSLGNISFTGAIPVIGEWNHFVMVYEDLNGNAVSNNDVSSQKSHSLKIYFNGSLVHTKTATNGYSLFGSTDFFLFGQYHYNGTTGNDANNNSYDFVELVTGAELTDAQVLAMYNNGERGWSVEDGMNYSS